MLDWFGRLRESLLGNLHFLLWGDFLETDRVGGERFRNNGYLGCLRELDRPLNRLTDGCCDGKPFVEWHEDGIGLEEDFLVTAPF